MAGRKTNPEDNRQEFHSARVAKAKTPKSKLWAYCHWLVAEAGEAGPEQVKEMTETVRGHIGALIEARKEV